MSSTFYAKYDAPAREAVIPRLRPNCTDIHIALGDNKGLKVVPFRPDQAGTLAIS